MVRWWLQYLKWKQDQLKVVYTGQPRTELPLLVITHNVSGMPRAQTCLFIISILLANCFHSATWLTRMIGYCAYQSYLMWNWTIWPISLCNVHRIGFHRAMVFTQLVFDEDWWRKSKYTGAVSFLIVLKSPWKTQPSFKANNQN